MSYWIQTPPGVKPPGYRTPEPRRWHTQVFWSGVAVFVVAAIVSIAGRII